jgi:hypothetical protein
MLSFGSLSIGDVCNRSVTLLYGFVRRRAGTNLSSNPFQTTHMSETRPETQKARSLCAMGGGTAGMVVLTVFLGFIEVQTRSQFGFFGAIARFSGTPDQIVLGFLLFAIAGIVIWPLLFVVVEPYLPGSSLHTNGLLVGVILWFVFLNFGAVINEFTTLVLYGVLTLLVFLVYGLTFGEVYSRLLRKRVQIDA